LVGADRDPAGQVEDIRIDLPAERDQLTTRSEPAFVELRSRAYALIQRAKSLST
jgi:NitT/TauT family transport system ATP-binding protein